MKKKNKIYFKNRIITKKITKVLNNEKKKYIIELFCGNSYITKTILKKKSFLKKLMIEKNKKYIKILKIKKINKIKKIFKKKKCNILIINPPYLEYKNKNKKKFFLEPIIAFTEFKKKINIKKKLKKILLKKKSKIIIEYKKYEIK